MHFPPVSSHSVIVFSWKPALSVHRNLNQVNVKFMSIEKNKSEKKNQKTKTLLRNYHSIFYNTFQYTTVNVRNLMVITASCPSIQTHTRIYIITTMKCSIEAWPLMLYFVFLVFCYIGRFQHN